MTWKNNRAISFVVVAVIYLLATALGVALCIWLPFDIWLDILIADVVATIFTFAFSVILKNASVYDPYWSVQPMVIGVALLIYTKQWTTYNILLVCVVLLWGVRLTANWAYTFANLACQDWRYTLLNQKTGKMYLFVNFTGIHLVPTLVVYGCVCPLIVAFQQNLPITWDSVDSLIWLGASLGAVVLQCVADVQMHKFRKDKRQGKTTEPFMRRGVWKYSRHPNYLAELLVWWGVGLSVVRMLDGAKYLLLLLGAIANTILFLCASIPLADGRQSKKEGFDNYKNTTFALLPLNKNWFKKHK